MSLLFLLSLLFAGLLATAAPIPRSTTQWFTVEWDATEFTAMSGNFVVPNANNGIVSLWPGLQGGEDVLQAELTGQSGKWNLGNSFYGLSEELHGSRFLASPGDTMHFSFARVSSSDLWTCTLSGPDSTEDTFSLPAKSLNRAIFAINLLGAQHDFNVLYTDVAITALTPAADWCTTTASNGYGAGNGEYIVKDATADGTTCHIGQIIMPGTA